MTHAPQPDDQRFDDSIRARLASAGAMLPELQKLMAASTTISREIAETLVIRENVLAKATLTNRRMVLAKLVERYTLDARDRVFASFKHEWDRESAESQRALLAYLMMATNDALMRVLNLKWLAPKLHGPDKSLTYDDLQAALDSLARENPQIGEWAASTRTRIMQHYLGAIRDFGLAKGIRTKRVACPVVGDRPVLLAARLSIIEGLFGENLVTSDWFGMLGFRAGEVAVRLLNLNAAGLAQVRVQGDVIDIEFFENVGEVDEHD